MTEEFVVKYHHQVGPDLFNVTTGRFVLDFETGEPVKADPATGKAKVDVEKCPTCKRPMPARKR